MCQNQRDRYSGLLSKLKKTRVPVPLAFLPSLSSPAPSAKLPANQITLLSQPATPSSSNWMLPASFLSLYDPARFFQQVSRRNGHD